MSEQNGKPADFSGGIGGQCPVDPRTGGKDLALLRRAIKAEWRIKSEYRRLVINEMAALVHKSSDERIKISAAKVLIVADAINAKREATELQKEQGPGVVNLNLANPFGMTPAEFEALTIERQLALLRGDG